MRFACRLSVEGVEDYVHTCVSFISRRTVRGGENKAVYAYSVDACPFWKSERPNDEITFGAFGENLSIDILPEDQIFIRDTYEVGGAILQAVQPRFPCYKLGEKFNDPQILRSFMRFGRPGVYFKVLQEGAVDQGDAFTLVDAENEKISVARLFSIFKDSDLAPDELGSLLKIQSSAARNARTDCVHVGAQRINKNRQKLPYEAFQESMSATVKGSR